MGKPLRGKVKKPTFPLRLEIPQRARDSHFPTPATAGLRLHIKWRDNLPQSYILKWLDAAISRAFPSFARSPHFCSSCKEGDFQSGPLRLENCAHGTRFDI